VRAARLVRTQQQSLARERLLAGAEQALARHGYGGGSIDLLTDGGRLLEGCNLFQFRVERGGLPRAVARVHGALYGGNGRIVSLAPHQPSATLSARLETVHADSGSPLLMTELQLHAEIPVFAERA
jgi:hypothetical protein